MRIAMIGQKGIPATYGGVERHVEELSAHLVQRGHEVTAYCRRHYTPSMREHRGIHLKILPTIHTKRLDAISHTALAVSDALRRGFDVFHFHGIGPASLSFVPRVLCRRAMAVVATVHALDWRRRKWGMFARWYLRQGARAAVRFPHRTITVSRGMADHFRLGGKTVVCIPNGVPAAQPTPIQELETFGLREKRFVLWLGRFVPEKRVEHLIRAFRSVSSDRILLLAGETDETDPYLKSVKAERKDDERIIFCGGLYGRAKAEALSHAELVVLPSEMEGFPITLLEAMRYARPVLASDIPEHLEAVQPDVNAFVFPVGDADALAERMQWILGHPDEAASVAQRAEKTAREYDWGLIAERTERVYEEASRITLDTGG